MIQRLSYCFSFLRRLRYAPIAVFLCEICGCGDGQVEPALDLALVPDPNLNSAEQIAGRVDSIVLVLDAATGLYAGQPQTVGNVQIKNADGDPELELVVAAALPAGRLPRLRLLRGELPDVPLEIRIAGLSARAGDPSPVASGRVFGARFSAGQMDFPVPFNLVPEVLPPRVIDTSPTDGGTAQGCGVPLITLVFSKPISAASLQAPGALTVVPGGPPARITVDASGRVASFAPTGLTGNPVSGINYRITVSTTVVDASGATLDQLPGIAGAEPFVADFHLLCAGP